MKKAEGSADGLKRHREIWVLVARSPFTSVFSSVEWDGNVPLARAAGVINWPQGWKPPEWLPMPGA